MRSVSVASVVGRRETSKWKLPSFDNFVCAFWKCHWQVEKSRDRSSFETCVRCDFGVWYCAILQKRMLSKKYLLSCQLNPRCSRVFGRIIPQRTHRKSHWLFVTKNIQLKFFLETHKVRQAYMLGNGLLFAGADTKIFKSLLASADGKSEKKWGFRVLKCSGEELTHFYSVLAAHLQCLRAQCVLKVRLEGYLIYGG